MAIGAVSQDESSWETLDPVIKSACEELLRNSQRTMAGRRTTWENRDCAATIFGIGRVEEMTCLPASYLGGGGMVLKTAPTMQPRSPRQGLTYSEIIDAYGEECSRDEASIASTVNSWMADVDLCVVKDEESQTYTLYSKAEHNAVTGGLSGTILFSGLNDKDAVQKIAILYLEYHRRFIDINPNIRNNGEPMAGGGGEEFQGKETCRAILEVVRLKLHEATILVAPTSEQH